MGYIVFRGVSTNDLTGIAIAKMPSHKKAGRRMTEYYIAGRDGAVHVDNGMADIQIEATLVLLAQPAEARQIVNAWADGTGKLVSSDQPGLAWKGTVIDEIRWSRVLGNKLPINGVPKDTFFDTAKITWTCDPYMYEAEDSEILLDVPGETYSILNPGSAEALPLIQVNGSGDATFSVNGEEIQIASMTAEVPVYIDCNAGYVWTENSATSITGGFPVLQMGTNSIVLGSGVSSLVITPHWRWV